MSAVGFAPRVFERFAPRVFERIHSRHFHPVFAAFYGFLINFVILSSHIFNFPRSMQNTVHKSGRSTVMPRPPPPPPRGEGLVAQSLNTWAYRSAEALQL